MEYKISTFGMWDLRLEKHMESKGFFRNAAGSSKVGEIRLVKEADVWQFENFLTKNDEIYYMELGCVKIPGLHIKVKIPGFTYQGETPRISIGDKENNIPAEERIKFLYEALISNENYNRLTIIHKDSNSSRRIKLLFEIDKANVKIDDIDIIAFFIMAYRSKK